LQVETGIGVSHRLSIYLSCHALQVETGIVGVSPGEETRKYLLVVQSQVRTVGGAAMAALAVAAMLFDKHCMRTIGTPLGSLSLLLVVNLITSSMRQVRNILYPTHYLIASSHVPGCTRGALSSTHSFPHHLCLRVRLSALLLVLSPSTRQSACRLWPLSGCCLFVTSMPT
jgi:hypothetical protein